jgi:2'-5' RNA ligase
MARVFVAVRPPSEVRAEIERLPRLEHPGIRWVPPLHWHVTLRFLGCCEPDEVRAALAGVELPRATVVLGPRVSLLGRGVVILPAAGLEDMAAVVADATAGIGEPPGSRGFHGHLTLARLKGRAVCAAVGERFEGGFDVGEVEVVSSVTDPAGAIHEVLARFPCAAGNAGPNTRS